MPFSKDKKQRQKKERPKDRFTIKNETRGIITHTNGVYIIKDEATGVSYLALRDSGSTSVTPLLGPDGKPIIDPIIVSESE